VSLQNDNSSIKNHKKTYDVTSKIRTFSESIYIDVNNRLWTWKAMTVGKSIEVIATALYRSIVAFSPPYFAIRTD
jgi:hypothetical protein